MSTRPGVHAGARPGPNALDPAALDAQGRAAVGVKPEFATLYKMFGDYERVR